MTEYLSTEETKTHFDECFARLEKNGLGDMLTMLRLRILYEGKTLKEFANNK